MDDPLSALDANVKKKIFKDVFKWKFKGKTIVLVTHAIDFLEHVDRIIIMEKGRIIHDGTYNDLLHTPQMKHIIETQNLTKLEEQKEEFEDLEDSPVKERKLLKEKSKEETNLMAKEGTIITKDEEDEVITVKWTVYKDYFKEGYMWVAVFLISAPLTGLGCWCWMVM